MIKATINGKTEFTVEGKTLNGQPVEWDLMEVRNHTFHIIRQNKGYTATVVSVNREEKALVVRVNGNEYEISIKDKYDLLLQQLGMSAGTASAAQHVKAPMPGLILNVVASEGTEVKKGEPLLILEAMKMENVIKSPRDGRVKKVHVSLRQAVEKNQVLLEFE